MAGSRTVNVNRRLAGLADDEPRHRVRAGEEAGRVPNFEQELISGMNPSLTRIEAAAER